MKTLPSLHQRGVDLASAEYQKKILGKVNGLARFEDHLEGSGLLPLKTTDIQVLQINVGRLCNQTCRHCHVDAGPDRKEIMTQETAEACIRALAASEIPTVDITGGAPEIHPTFRYLVEESAKLGRHIMDRCNLTVLTLRSQRDLVDFLAEHNVEVVASLPYYQPRQTDAQRGDGVFDQSIEALQKLNAAGYGRGTGRRLTLVYNPVGAFLPPK
ncbi:MAG: radical SAM protein, partial [Gemmatimonadetes bacterium]|nr:radical SAM protein [Gemmatimonadota bacterium]